MKAILIATVLAATPAIAQPVEHCTVTIARAPDDVRPIVEQWVRAEPSCNVSLEVRIVPTDGGYYILARDEYNRVRERIVPDAQSAGVLVASWIADDTMRAPAAELPAPAQQPPPAVLVSAQPAYTGEVLAPGVTPALPARVNAKWLSLAGMLAPQEQGAGLRAELDVYAWRAWTLGVAASVSHAQRIIWGYEVYGQGTMNMVDYKAVAYASHTERWGRWRLREAVGAGAVYARIELMTPSTSGWWLATGDGLFLTAEASLLFGRELGSNWAIAIGPIATLVAQTYNVYMTTGPDPQQLQRNDIEVMLAAVVRYRL